VNSETPVSPRFLIQRNAQSSVLWRSLARSQQYAYFEKDSVNESRLQEVTETGLVHSKPEVVGFRADARLVITSLLRG